MLVLTTLVFMGANSLFLNRHSFVVFLLREVLRGLGNLVLTCYWDHDTQLVVI